MELQAPLVRPELDAEFRPASLAWRAFARSIEGRSQSIRIAVEQGDGSTFVFERQIARDTGSAAFAANLRFLERDIKFLLWAVGGWRLHIDAPEMLVGLLRDYHYKYSPNRLFDMKVLGATIYGRPFTIVHAERNAFPKPSHVTLPLGRHHGGCRVAIDKGASDIKAYAERDGKTVFAGEFKWDPKPQADPAYHYEHIRHALRKAAAALPRVDAIGVSSAGVYVNNEPRIASLFRGVPAEAFAREIVPMYHRIREEFGGVPLVVANDGAVSALAGSMSLGRNRILGLAFGSSLAAGYADAAGNITTWLDELAFVPIDMNPLAPADEWSGDRGCGVQYLSQQAVDRLLGPAGIEVPAEMSVPERLEHVQALMRHGDERAARIYQTIGVYFGHAVAHYANYYDVGTVLVMGRVTTGTGGEIILRTAQEVLGREFPDLEIDLRLPDEASRRVGQAAAAASLPQIVTQGR
ncbi:MAG: ROK family protein [Bryobacterales bacterium]|nr:ROK family protein [Bryobacterales bacterium]